MTEAGPDDGTVHLDLRGLKCPLPVLHARKALAKAAPGTRIVVRCTDPMSAIDIPHLVHETGHALEAKEMADGVLTFRLLRRPLASDQR
ncbi:sulfurtransferase TusA family protein [Aquabacter cavernae]|uniref:sulfurtransferase TusA family protein n=1 Tax=Aquabacter cavernae TaxID=2496029 RepID=UPI000F8F4DAE|nr:sulfurtransferase TusA family protein [Aquabacter cavernae]